MAALLVAWRWRWRRRSERGRTDGQEKDRQAIAVIDVLIAVAQAQIGLQYQSSDAHDAKSLGILAADAAAFAVIVPTRLDRLWWVPLIGFAASIVCLVLCVRNRKYDRGPDIALFYEAKGGAEELDAKSQMLSQLIRALTDNENLLPSKARWFTAGFTLFVLSLVGGATLLGVVR